MIEWHTWGLRISSALQVLTTDVSSLRADINDRFAELQRDVSATHSIWSAVAKRLGLDLGDDGEPDQSPPEAPRTDPEES